MNYIALFFAGVFLCNSLPHLCSGLCGAPFPTPFAKPRGVGDSSPLVNFLWGIANLLAGLALLGRHPVALTPNLDMAALLCGVLLLGTHCSIHFGNVRRAKREP